MLRLTSKPIDALFSTLPWPRGVTSPSSPVVRLRQIVLASPASQQPGLRRVWWLGRSSFPGTGAYAAHWSGDNAATWDDLRWSVTSILAPGLAGIPLVGTPHKV